MASIPQLYNLFCDVCKRDITGVRFKCVNCVDFDLCSECESKNPHNVDHAFLKLTRRTPIIHRQILIPYSLYTLQPVTSDENPQASFLNSTPFVSFSPSPSSIPPSSIPPSSISPSSISSSTPLYLSPHSPTAQLVKSGNEFGFNLLRTKIQNNINNTENVFISPLSISTCLLLAANGAIDVTLSEMLNVLGYGTDMNKINSSLNEYLRVITSSKDTTISVANSVWFNTAFAPLNANYTKLVQQYYDAEVFSQIDQTKINQWVQAKTNNKIDSLLLHNIPQHSAVLINAIYFKGDWKKSFDPAPFPGDGFSNEWAHYSYMRCSNKFMYYENMNSGVQAAAIPYMFDGSHAVVILPPMGQNISELVSSLQGKVWDSLIGTMSSTQGTLVMPKFKFSCEFSLKSVLQQLGINRAFSATAQIPNIVASGLWIDDVIHKTFVDCNETGTEAAAVTAVACFGSSAPTKSFYMKVTRPFVFAICDSNSNPMFIGVINKPIYN